MTVYFEKNLFSFFEIHLIDFLLLLLLPSFADQRNINESDHVYLQNIASSYAGANCTSSPSTMYFNCTGALDYDKSTEWKSNCSGIECINTTINIYFSTNEIPQFFCFSSRYLGFIRFFYDAYYQL